MDKDQFIKVLHHYSGSTVEEAQDVLSLKEDYPYSQLLHALSARVTKDHGFSNQGGELQLAAVYAADRAVLKEIMYEEPSSPVVDHLPVAQTRAITPAKTTEAIVPPTTASSDSASNDVAEEVLHDLERLHELKHNFEMMFNEETSAERPVVKIPVAKEIDTPKVEETSTVEEIPQVDEATKTEALKGKSKKERIVEMARALEQKNAQRAENQEEVKEEKKPRKKRKHDGEELIEEIASTKEELEPENEKQKEQIEIIDQFIKSQPMIANSKDKPLPPPVGDLAANTKTGEFGDNIVSETLVEILVKQGKKDRAIEVLKKLIWKFPQKKAYFAAQIEELKK